MDACKIRELVSTERRALVKLLSERARATLLAKRLGSSLTAQMHYPGCAHGDAFHRVPKCQFEDAVRFQALTHRSRSTVLLPIPLCRLASLRLVVIFVTVPVFRYFDFSVLSDSSRRS